jgi:hypothetical protein
MHACTQSGLDAGSHLLAASAPCCCSTSRLFVLDTATGKVVAAGMLEPGRACSALAWAPQDSGGGQGPAGYTLATAADTNITLWAVNPYGGCMKGTRVVPGSVRRQITCLAFSADGQWLFAGRCEKGNTAN